MSTLCWTVSLKSLRVLRFVEKSEGEIMSAAVVFSVYSLTPRRAEESRTSPAVPRTTSCSEDDAWSVLSQPVEVKIRTANGVLCRGSERWLFMTLKTDILCAIITKNSVIYRISYKHYHLLNSALSVHVFIARKVGETWILKTPAGLSGSMYLKQII